MATGQGRRRTRNVAAALAEARRLIVRLSGWEAADINRLIKDAAEVGLYTIPDIHAALRWVMVHEVKPSHGNRRPDRSFEPLCKDEALYEFTWESDRLRRQMYLKFAIVPDRVVMVSFHRSRVIPMKKQERRR